MLGRLRKLWRQARFVRMMRRMVGREHHEWLIKVASLYPGGSSDPPDAERSE